MRKTTLVYKGYIVIHYIRANLPDSIEGTLGKEGGQDCLNFFLSIIIVRVGEVKPIELEDALVVGNKLIALSIEMEKEELMLYISVPLLTELTLGQKVIWVAVGIQFGVYNEDTVVDEIVAVEKKTDCDDTYCQMSPCVVPRQPW